MKFSKHVNLMWVSLLGLSMSLLLVSSTIAQTVIRVDNNTGATGADHTNLQDAYNAASAGDTLYLVASPIPYGDANDAYSFTLTKKVHLLGEGMGANPEGNTDTTNSIRTRIGQLDVKSGAEGTSIQAIYFDGAKQVDPVFQSQLRIFTNNIIVARCSLDAIFLKKDDAANKFASNCVITQNFFRRESSINDVGGVFVEDQCNYNIITNNIMPHVIGTRENANNIIRNNTFYGNSFREVRVVSAFASDIKNNIIIEIPTSGNTSPFFTNIRIENNVMVNNLFPFSIAGLDIPFNSNYEKDLNQFDVTMTNVFEATAFNKPNFQAEYKLKTGSPALGAGFNGGDCGAYGGATPYIISGTGVLPSVSELTNTGGIKFQFKAQIKQ